MQNLDIGSAFSFTFDDKDWVKKIAIGGVAGLLGVIIFIPIFVVPGYMLQLIKNVRDNQPNPLPEWDNLGEMFIKGLIVSAIALVYNIIPPILIMCPLIPLIYLTDQAGPDMAGAIALLINCFICVGIAVFILVNLLVPAAFIRYANYDSFAAAFQIREIFSFIKNNIGDYIIVILLSYVASLVATMGFILCLVGVFFTNFWAITVTGHLYGQLARKAQETV